MHEVQAVIRSQLKTVHLCYDKHTNATKDVSIGKITVDFEIDPDGRPNSCSIAVDNTGVPSLARCVCESVTGWEFPKPRAEQIVHVKYPFIFNIDPPDGLTIDSVKQTLQQEQHAFEGCYKIWSSRQKSDKMKAKVSWNPKGQVLDVVAVAPPTKSEEAFACFSSVLRTLPFTSCREKDIESISTIIEIEATSSK